MGLMKSPCSKLEKLKEKRKLVQENIIWAKAICPSVDISFSECGTDVYRYVTTCFCWSVGGELWPPRQSLHLHSVWGHSAFQEFFPLMPGMWLLSAHPSQSHIFKQASKYNFKTILFPASYTVLLIFPPMSVPQHQSGCCVLNIWSPELSIS